MENPIEPPELECRLCSRITLMATVVTNEKRELRGLCGFCTAMTVYMAHRSHEHPDHDCDMAPRPEDFDEVFLSKDGKDTADAIARMFLPHKR